MNKYLNNLYIFMLNTFLKKGHESFRFIRSFLYKAWC